MSIKKKIAKTLVAIKLPFLVLFVLALLVPSMDLPVTMVNGESRLMFIYLGTVANVLTFAYPLFTLGLIAKVGVTIYFIWRK